MNGIPPITDPLGRYWRQPSVWRIEIDDTHALMNQTTFFDLAEYSCSMPSGVYAGKMWRASFSTGHFLRWYGIEPGREDICTNNQRLVLFTDAEPPLPS